MFTVCPKCTLTLVVTTVDLRAGQGYVRCGRCANVFNALIALREGEHGGSTSDSASRRLQETTPPASVNPAVGAGIADFEPEPEADPEPEPEPESESESESEAEAEPESEPAFETEPQPDFETEAANAVETEASAEESSLEFDAASTDVSEIFVSLTEADPGSGSYEAVVLSAESAAEAAVEDNAVTAAEDDASHADTIARADWSLLDDEPVADAESVIEESPLSAESPQPDPPWVEEMFAEAEAEAERVRTAERAALTLASQAPFQGEDDAQAPDAEQDTTESAEPPADAELEPLLKPPARPRPGWQLTTGVAALGLLLLAQMVHFNRQQLVLNETFGPAISRVYGWFGMPPTPRWDLAAYSVKQLGAEAEGGEGTQLLVRLSLQNESSRVQPLPLLRLTLQDRYGNAVATRDLEPRDYLPPRAANQRLLEPDQRIDAELHVIDPGRAAIGFEIDACLRGDGDNIGCANDARRRSAG